MQAAQLLARARRVRLFQSGAADAPLAGIYGGSLEVFRNMIAQHVLGLGKPSYGSFRPK